VDRFRPMIAGRAADDCRSLQLGGNLDSFQSIRVNKQWRLVFRWDGERGEATGIYLDDHSYR
jgi:plasmid maintenance system killer protein